MSRSSTRRPPLSRAREHFPRAFRVAAWLSAAVALATPSARAASPQKVSPGDWRVNGLPSYVNLYIHVPDRLATKPPIVVAPHHCQGSGPGTYNEMSSLVAIANSTGFIMIFPEATGQNCWDAGSARSLRHDGGGDTHAIVQMVRYALAKYDGDASRVYSVGGSSGGIMTEALLGVYPDVFMAGVSVMGVPCGCWAEGYHDVIGTGNSAQWSGACAGATVKKSGQQWGDLVRSYFPGYSGHRPRLQHWHGTADTTLRYGNVAEDVKEWTNLLGLPEQPTGTDTPKSGTTRQFWKNACGYTVYETFSVSGAGHTLPIDGKAVAAYFGLDKPGGQDPEAAACSASPPGGSGAGGAGSAGSGGAGGREGGSGGSSESGGMGGPGGMAATGGSAGTGGANTGGTDAETGTGGLPPTNGTGGVPPGGGSIGTGGIAGGVPVATGGAAIPVGTGGSYVASGGMNLANGGQRDPDDSAAGCTCTASSIASPFDASSTAVALSTLGLLSAARRRRRF